MKKKICFLSFFIMPAFGFFTHELGHFLSARYFGHKEVRLHYRSTSSWKQSDSGKERRSFIKPKTEQLIVAGSGPLVTFILGIIGATLFLRNYSRRPLLISNMIWLSVVSLLLRFPFDLFTILADQSGKRLFNSDEYKMSLALSLGAYFFHLAFMTVAVNLLLICFFKLSKEDKILFLMVGLPGGILGLLFWIYLLGPIVLP